MPDRIQRGKKLTAAVFVMALLPAVCGHAQSDGRYQPIDQWMAPGQAAAWMSGARNQAAPWLQPVRIEVVGGATVSAYSASPEPQIIEPTPAQFSVNPGHFYRLRLADMPDFPQTELYPTIEILDHLHPPEGTAEDFPIPVVITAEDIRLAINGRLVTKVVYLEQPQLAVAYDPLRREIPQSVDPADNAIQKADQLGRPMIIVRIGGRLPPQHHIPLSFFGSGGALVPAARSNDAVSLTRAGTAASAMAQLSLPQ